MDVGESGIPSMETIRIQKYSCIGKGEFWMTWCLFFFRSCCGMTHADWQFWKVDGNAVIIIAPRIRYVCKRILVYSGRWLLRIFWRALLACTDRLRMNWWPTMMTVMMRSPVTTDRSYQPWSSNLFSSDFRLGVLLSSSLKWSVTDDLLAQPFSFGSSHLCTFTVNSDLLHAVLPKSRLRNILSPAGCRAHVEIVSNPSKFGQSTLMCQP